MSDTIKQEITNPKISNLDIPQLDLNKDYSVEMLSWYIWGRKEAPKKHEIANSHWITRKGDITLRVDPNQFLQKAGNVVNARG